SLMLALLFRLSVLPSSTLFRSPGETGLRVDREHDAGGTEIRAEHRLHADRERDPVLIDAVVLAIGDGAIRVERGTAAPPGVEQRDRKSTRLNSSHVKTPYAAFC